MGTLPKKIFLSWVILVVHGSLWCHSFFLHDSKACLTVPLGRTFSPVVQC